MGKLLTWSLVLLILLEFIGIGFILYALGQRPDPIIEVEIVTVTEYIVTERVVEVAAPEAPVRCYWATESAELAVIFLPLQDFGPPPENYTGTVGYLCNDRMLYIPELPVGAEVINVEAHLGALKVGRNGE